MSKIIVFIQAHGRPGIIEAELADAATLGELHGVLTAAGIKIDSELFIFIDESEHHLQGEHHHQVGGLKHGCRIHVSRCKRIKTTVNYQERTAEHDFPPGARVRAVKEFAVRKFELQPKDAAEHVLQICKSKERPSSDTPLHQLVQGHCDGHNCAVCFDLVPDKRVEG